MKDRDIIKGLIRHRSNKLAAEMLVNLSSGCRLSSKDRKVAIDIINGIEPNKKPDEKQLALVKKLEALEQTSGSGRFIYDMIQKGKQEPWSDNQKFIVEKIIYESERSKG
jgi:hypothetical protein